MTSSAVLLKGELHLRREVRLSSSSFFSLLLFLDRMQKSFPAACILWEGFLIQADKGIGTDYIYYEEMLEFYEECIAACAILSM